MPLRHPIVAGQFYDTDPSHLQATLSGLLQPAGGAWIPTSMRESLPQSAVYTPTGTRVPANFVMLPHAGIVFSGATAGRTLACANLPSRLILLCPNHTGRGAPLAVWSQGAWLTPLGKVSIDEDTAMALCQASPDFTNDPTAHMHEHALEVLLPFLQLHTPHVCITPVCVRGSLQSLKAAASALAKVIQSNHAQGKPTGLVLSSDMNHFATLDDTLLRDATALNRLLAVDPEGLHRVVEEHAISMCGIAPAILSLYTMQALEQCGVLSAFTPKLVAYDTSATACGDTTRVVGYAGILG